MRNAIIRLGNGIVQRAQLIGAAVVPLLVLLFQLLNKHWLTIQKYVGMDHINEVIERIGEFFNKDRAYNSLKNSLNYSYNKSDSIINTVLFLYDKNLSKQDYAPIQLESNNQITQTANIFNSTDKVVVVADSGAGKSTWLEYCTYLWNKGRLWNDRFDLVFFISLPELAKYYISQDEKIKLRIEDAIDALCIHEDLRETYNTKSLIPGRTGRINQVLHARKDKILYILDAYDEAQHDFNTNPKLSKVLTALFKNKNLLITTRFYTLHFLSEDLLKANPNYKLSSTSSDRPPLFKRMDFKGLDPNTGIPSYIEKFFSLLKPKDEAIDLINSFTKFFINKGNGYSFGSLIQSPLYLQLLCSIWEKRAMEKSVIAIADDTPPKDDLVSHLTMTHIYYKTVVYQAQRYLRKKEERENKLLGFISDFSTLRQADHILKFIKNFVGSRLELGAQLRNESHPTQFEEALLELNILTCTRKNGKIENLKFTHPVFEKFFLAWYKAEQLINNEIASVIPYADIQNERHKWHEHYSTGNLNRIDSDKINELAFIVGILWETLQYEQLLNIVKFLFGDPDTGKLAVDKYTLPLAILCLEELTLEETINIASLAALIAFKDIVVTSAKNMINELLNWDISNDFPLFRETQNEYTYFVNALNAAVYMKQTIISEESLLSTLETKPSSNCIELIQRFKFQSVTITQQLLELLAGDNSIAHHAKGALIQIKIDRKTLENSLFDLNDYDIVTVRKCNILIELNYVDQTLNKQLISMFSKNESSCIRAIIIFNLINNPGNPVEEHFAKEFNDKFLYLYQSNDFSSCGSRLLVTAQRLNFFKDKENCSKFSAAVSQILKLSIPESILNVLYMLSGLEKNFLEQIMLADNNKLELAIIKILDPVLLTDNRSEILQRGLRLITQFPIPELLDKLKDLSENPIEGSANIQKEAIEALFTYEFNEIFPVLDRIISNLKTREEPKKVIVKGLVKFRSKMNFEKIFSILLKPLSIHVGGPSEFHLEVVESLGALYEKATDEMIETNNVKINSALLHLVPTTLTAVQTKIAEIIRKSNMTFEVNNHLKNIISTTSISMPNKEKIIKQFIPLDDTIDELLKNEACFLHGAIPHLYLEENILPTLSRNEEMKRKLIAAWEGASEELANKIQKYLHSIFSQSQEESYSLVKTLSTLNTEGALKCNELLLSILIKSLAIGSKAEIKNLACDMLDKLYLINKRHFKETLKKLTPYQLTYMDEINNYYGSWFGSSVYNQLKNIKGSAFTSSAIHTISIPFWFKPLNLVTKVVKTTVQVTREKVLDLAGVTLGTVSTVTGYISGTSAAPDQIKTKRATDRILLEGKNDPTDRKEHHEKNRDETHSKNNQSSPPKSFFINPEYLRIKPNSTLPFTRSEKLEMIGACMNYVLQKSQRVGYKPLSRRMAAIHKRQHREQLEDIVGSLKKMEEHSILCRQQEYFSAKTALEAAETRFKNYFRRPVTRHSVTLHENMEVENLIDRAQKYLTIAEALQGKIDTEYPGLVYKVNEMTRECNRLSLIVQKTQYSLDLKVKKLKEKQNVIIGKIRITENQNEQLELDAHWKVLDAEIVKQLNEQDELVPFYSSLKFLLVEAKGKLRQALSPDHLVDVEKYLNTARKATLDLENQKASSEHEMLILTSKLQSEKLLENSIYLHQNEMQNCNGSLATPFLPNFYATNKVERLRSTSYMPLQPKVDLLR
jgi:uncharacterized protein YbcV (DUF1398 family)